MSHLNTSMLADFLLQIKLLCQLILSRETAIFFMGSRHFRLVRPIHHLPMNAHCEYIFVCVLMLSIFLRLIQGISQRCIQHLMITRWQSNNPRKLSDVTSKSSSFIYLNKYIIICVTLTADMILLKH